MQADAAANGKYMKLNKICNLFCSVPVLKVNTDTNAKFSQVQHTMFNSQDVLQVSTAQ